MLNALTYQGFPRHDEHLLQLVIGSNGTESGVDDAGRVSGPAAVLRALRIHRARSRTCTDGIEVDDMAAHPSIKVGLCGRQLSLSGLNADITWSSYRSTHLSLYLPRYFSSQKGIQV